MASSGDVNCIGKENLEGIDEFFIEMKDLFDIIDNSDNESGANALKELVKQTFNFIHFNEDHPENHNILVSSQTYPEGTQIFTNGQWINVGEDFWLRKSKKIYDIIKERTRYKDDLIQHK